MTDTAKIFTREELRKAIRHWVDHIATVSLNPDTPEACADYVYDHYGIQTDISLLDHAQPEPAHAGPGLCVRCGDYDPNLTDGVCPVCRETGGPVMSEQQREQVRRLIAEQVGVTSPFILVYDTSGLDETMAGGAHLDYLTDPHSSTFTIIGMLSCLLAWLTKGHQA